MMNAPRFLPVALVFALALLGVKAGDVWEGSREVLAELSVSEALAQDEPAPPAFPDDAPADDPAEPAAELDGAAEIDGAFEGADEAVAAAAPAGPPVLNPNSPFTAAELDMLQNLAMRREELDGREAEMDLRANLLAVTERRIEERIAELRSVEETIQSLLIKYDEQEEEQLRSVVAIYEAMKPQDAAKIFDTLEMVILIELAERMKERLIAPILADMDPNAANALTVELATRRALPVTGRPGG